MERDFYRYYKGLMCGMIPGFLLVGHDILYRSFPFNGKITLGDGGFTSLSALAGGIGAMVLGRLNDAVTAHDIKTADYLVQNGVNLGSRNRYSTRPTILNSSAMFSI